MRAFRENAKALATVDAAIFGVSQDDGSTQKRFCDAENLPYDLLVDEGGKLAEAFGVPRIRGGKLDARWTIVIGRDGKVVTVDSEVGKDIAGHPQRLLADLKKDWEGYKKGFKPLFNGKDLTGWKPVSASADTWTVDDGVLVCSGKPRCYLRTTKAYEDYALLVEFRYTEKLGNGGILVHITGEDKVWPKSLEPNLNINGFGRIYEIGGTKIKHAREDKKPLVAIDVKPREWNRYEIVCKGDTITVTLNGILVNRGTDASVTRGTIGIQSEGVPLQFRTVAIKPLTE